MCVEWNDVDEGVCESISVCGWYQIYTQDIQSPTIENLMGCGLLCDGIGYMTIHCRISYVILIYKTQ